MSWPVLIVGSTALDSVETPAGKVENALGGSAFFSAAAASFKAPVHLVGVVGDDFKLEQLDFLKKRGVDLSGLQVVPGGKTFRWGGRYHEHMNHRDTLFTELGVFESFDPVIPDHAADGPLVLLANIQPSLQMRVLDQIRNPRAVVTDTMNLWINLDLSGLKQVVARTDILILNDEEAQMLTDEQNILRAGRKLQDLGPKTIVVKKGEHGAILLNGESILCATAWPLENVVDPTGAGDTFAGGFLSTLAAAGEINDSTLRQALARGTVLASYCCEDFSLRRLAGLSEEEITARMAQFRQLTDFTL